MRQKESQNMKIARGFLSACSMLMLVAAALFLPHGSLHAQEPPTDQYFELIYQTNSPEKYGTLVEGFGMAGKTTGTLPDVEVPGNRIVKTFLVWAGLGSDPTVTFNRDTEDAIVVNADPDKIWDSANFGGLATWGCCGSELSVYAADISDQEIVTTGQHSYTLSDMDTGVENWGFTLIVVYEDLTLPAPRNVIVKLGNDGLHFRWGMPLRPDIPWLGPNSDVQCVAFDSSEIARDTTFDFIVGGISDNFRPNGLWTATGNEPYVDPNDQGGTWTHSEGLITLPANPNPNPPASPSPAYVGIDGAMEYDGPLDGDKTGNGVDWPFSDESGAQWDRYETDVIRLEPGGEWICFQVESANRPGLPPLPGDRPPDVPDTYQLGASIGFLGFVAVVEEPAGAIGVEASPEYSWTYTVGNPDLPDLPSLEQVRLVAGPYISVVCPKTTLAVGESMTCTASSIDLAYYGSAAWAIGVPVGGGNPVLKYIVPDPLGPQP